VRRYFPHIIFFCFWSVFVCGQNSNLRFKTVPPGQDTLSLDSLTIVPGSFSFFQPGDSSAFIINYSTKKIIRKAKGVPADSVRFTFRVFPFNFEKKYFHKDIKKLNQDLSAADNPFSIFYNKNPDKTKTGFETDGLTKNGSISRGIMFGNNQDVVVNSNLNLQVSGKLGNNIELSLAATDNNIPIQPEGNTQQLQEFDKVYIQLNDQHSKLLVGDFQLERPKSYFMNFYKRTQGMYVSNNYIFDYYPQTEKNQAPKARSSLTSTFSGAVSKGRFARNVIQGTENNQGPYRLRGADNELFIIVLSGTEKVYIDGRLLTRGQENDYIIDYNSSEISFTARNIITKDKRIIVEFQYAERNYARALYFAGTEYKSERLKLSFNFYQESDNKNKTLQQPLTNKEKLILTQIGDTLSSAVVPGDTLSEFNTLEVFYHKKDTVVNTVLYSGVFVYSTNPDSAKYRVKFSYVGAGNGNYRQVPSSANGKVYQWYVPVAGLRQGDFEPVILLVTPKKKQMLTVGAEYKMGAGGFLSVEGALTNNDLNTFSPVGNSNNDGQGIKFLMGNKSILAKGDSLGKKKFTMAYGAGYEFLQLNFSQVERFRSVEFDRDWNRNLASVVENDQHIVSANLGFEFGKAMSTDYFFNSFIEGNSFLGMRHSLKNNYRSKFFNAGYTSSLTTTETTSGSTSFFRHKSYAAVKVKKIQFGYQDEFEHNLFRSAPSDSLQSRSYQFWEWEGNISNADTSGNYFKLFYKERLDRKAYTQRLGDSAYAQNAGFQYNLNKFRNHVLRTNLTVRKLQFLGTNQQNNKPDNNLLSRIEYSPKLWKGFFQSTLYYEVGYGLELRREFSYLEVAPGQGTYTWKDYNGNGIKELNEFEISQFSDQAIYIRVYTPTNNYVKVNHDQFSYSLHLRPSVFRRENSRRIMKFFSRFATQTAYRIDKKTQSQFNVLNFNPFDANPDDSLLMSMTFNFRQALFFNQSAQVFGFDFTYQDNRNKQLLTNGFESRGLQTNELRVRWNITRAWGFFVNSTYGLKSNASQFFSTRNYKINYYETEPRVAYQPNTSFRVSLIYKRVEKRNIIENGFQRATIDDMGTELRYNQLSKGSFSARGNFIVIQYNDAENTPVAFEMLNALKTGQNFTWNFSYQRNLSNNMQVSITYDGRKTPGNRVVHIGGAQVRAFF
jgi:hypothetical protein